MTTHEFLTILRDHATLPLAFELPDGTDIPAHFHITEVGHIRKSFIDCGGHRHSHEACLLQVWVADDIDHRLPAGKLADIFSRAGDLLPDLELPVEIEHEAPVLTQLQVVSHKVQGGHLRFVLGLKHTDCLAKDVCLPDFSLPAVPGTCTANSGCC